VQWFGALWQPLQSPFAKSLPHFSHVMTTMKITSLLGFFLLFNHTGKSAMYNMTLSMQKACNGSKWQYVKANHLMR